MGEKIRSTTERVIKRLLESDGYDVTKTNPSREPGIPDFYCKKGNDEFYLEVKRAKPEGKPFNKKSMKMSQVKKWLELLKNGNRVKLAFLSNFDTDPAIIEINEDLEEIDRERKTIPPEVWPDRIHVFTCPECGDKIKAKRSWQTDALTHICREHYGKPAYEFETVVEDEWEADNSNG